MATVTISALTAVLAGDLDDTARVPVDDNDSHTRKATIAQLRTQIFSGAGVPLTCGAITASGTITGPGARMTLNGGEAMLTVENTEASGWRWDIFVGATGSLGEGTTYRGQWFLYDRTAPAIALRFDLSDNAYFYNAVSMGALTATTGKLTALGAFVAADKYVIVDAAGNLHVSALGPLS